MAVVEGGPQVLLVEETAVYVPGTSVISCTIANRVCEAFSIIIYMKLLTCLSVTVKASANHATQGASHGPHRGGYTNSILGGCDPIENIDTIQTFREPRKKEATRSLGCRGLQGIAKATAAVSFTGTATALSRLRPCTQLGFQNEGNRKWRWMLSAHFIDVNYHRRAAAEGTAECVHNRRRERSQQPRLRTVLPSDETLPPPSVSRSWASAATKVPDEA